MPGWLFEREAWRLHELARAGANGNPGEAVVEIGSFHGRSTIALACGLQEAGGGRLVAVDPQDDERFAALAANLRAAGVAGGVETLRTTSSGARELLGPLRVRLLFVDGSHDYEDVVDDLRGWAGSLAPGASVAVNDPFWDGVNRALRDRVARRGSAYREPCFVANTLFFRFEPSAPWSWRDSLRLARLRVVIVAGAGWYRRYHEPILDSTRLPRAVRLALVKPPVWLLPRLFELLLPAARPREG